MTETRWDQATRRDIPLDHRCDRCAHRLKEHAGPALGSICQVGRGKDTRLFCSCDGFVAEP